MSGDFLPHAVAHVPPPSTCTNCGAAGAVVYCPTCGERQPDHHDYSMGHFIGHAVHELVHLDSKLFVTLRLLVMQPGALTVEYFAGRKSRYIAPLRLFLVFFALFFLAYTTYKPLTIFSVSMAAKHDSKAIGALLDKVAKKKQMTREEVAEKIDANWQHAISILQLANIVAVGLSLAIVIRRRYLAEHFVFAAHYLSYSYLLSLALWPIRFFTGLGPGLAHRILSIGSTLILFVYLYFAMRRVYAAGFVRSLVAFFFIWLASMILTVGPFIAAILMIALH
jgi:hypothetical protein